MSDIHQPTGNLLRDRIILITGAGDGIGRAVALASAAQGARVILLGRTQEKLEAVYDAVDALPEAPEAVIHPLDLEIATEDHYRELADAIGDQFGRLDGLLHNASLLGNLTPLQYFPADRWASIMQVNVNAAFQLTRALLPIMNLADDGRILFTSSSVGRKGRAYWGAYSVSKFATEGLMQVLADELADTSNIRVNSINPGATRTAMRAAAYPAEDPGSLPTPEDLMSAYLYLLGPESRQLHGQALNIHDLL